MRVKVRNEIKLKQPLKSKLYIYKCREIFSRVETFETEFSHLDSFDKKLYIMYNIGGTIKVKIKELVPKLWIVRKDYRNLNKPSMVCYIHECDSKNPLNGERLHVDQST